MRKTPWLPILMLFLVACRPQPATSTPTATISVPTPTFTPMLPTPTPTPVIHVVQPGDALSAIAAQYGVPIDALAEANGIQDPNVIKVGQKLVIPGPTPVPTPTVPPTVTPTPHIPPQLEIVDVIGRGAPSAETVVLVNHGRNVSLNGWTLRDAQDNVFVFPNLYLATGAEVRIHTGQGDNTAQHIYWGRETAVWEEAGDVAVLADERGVMYATKPLD
jgi:LysM repeat protein